MLYIKTVLALFVCQSFCLQGTKSGKKSSKTSAVFKSLQEDVKKLKANNIKCKQTNIESIMRLKCEEKFDEALVCIGEKLLNGDSMNGKLWTVLGQVYDKRGEVSKGNKCFREASKIPFELVRHIKEWYFLGAFPIGKPELDGDPVETIGGIQKASCQRYNKKFVAYSEFMNGGKVGWSKIWAENNGVVSIEPNIDWNKVPVMEERVGAFEWQAWIIGDFYVNNEMTIYIQCLGVPTIYINEVILAADVDCRNKYW